VAVTFTRTEQVPLVVPVRAGIEAPVGLPNVNEVLPAVGDHVGVPPQVVVAAGVAATCNPIGNASVKLTPVNGTLFSFERVKVKVETPPTAIGFGENALVMVGGAATPQPVKITLSRCISAEAFFAPTTLTLNSVVDDPVVVAWNGPTDKNGNPLPAAIVCSVDQAPVLFGSE